MRASTTGYAKTLKTRRDLADDLATAVNASSLSDAEIAKRAGLIGNELEALLLQDEVDLAMANTVLGGLENPNSFVKTSIVNPPYLAPASYYGTATAGGATSLTDSAASGWVADKWIGATVTIVSGTGKGQKRQVLDNTTTALTVATWTTNPDNTSVYYITLPTGLPAPQTSGDTTPASGEVLTWNNATWAGDATITYARRWLRYTVGAHRQTDPTLITATSNPAVIAGETGTTYTLAAADVGKVIAVEVTATNDHGSTVAVSAHTAVVA